MPTTDLFTLTELAARLRRRDISVRELVDDALQHAAAEHSRLNAFITITADQARARAVELDELLAAGTDLGPLHGIPIAHKDCICTAGIRTTGGSKILADFMPQRSARVVKTLEAAGAVMIGKTGLHEFTYGISGVNPHYGPVHNPWDVKRVAGGSSSGSGAAVAGGIVPLATGTDTGGSIRIPASFCRCVGLKPTYKRPKGNSRLIMPLSPSQDHLGPMTRTVLDCQIAHSVMTGMATPATAAITNGSGRGFDVEATGFGTAGGFGTVPLKGLRIGIPTLYFWQLLDPEVERACLKAVAMCAQLGAEVLEVGLPHIEEVMQAARVILLYEGAAEVLRYSTNQADFGADVWVLLEQGRTVSDAAYRGALKAQRRLKRQLGSIWQEVECLITPTTPTPAFRIDQTEMLFGDPPTMQDVRAVTTRLTRPFNAMGWPALSLPCGLTEAKLPIGLQLIAADHREDVLFQVGEALERSIERF